MGNDKEQKNSLSSLDLRFLFFCSIFFSVCLFSCNKGNSEKQIRFQDLGNEGMIQNYPYTFFNSDLLGLDSLVNNRNVWLLIRYNDLCSVKTLPLRIEYVGLQSDTITNKLIDVNLFGKEDINEGKGNFALFESKVLLFRNTEIDADGFISISTPEPNASGIKSIGVFCEKSE